MVGDERPPRSRPPDLTAAGQTERAGADMMAALQPGSDAELTAGLRAGYDADLVVLDRDLLVSAVMVRGGWRGGSGADPRIDNP